MLAQAKLSPNFGVAQDCLESGFIFQGLRSVIFSVPQMKNGCCESAFLVKNALSNQSNRQVCIFVPPTVVGFIKAIDLLEILPPQRQIAGSGLLPACWPLLSP